MSDLVKWNQTDMDEEPTQELDASMIPADPPGYVPVAEVSQEDDPIADLAAIVGDEEAEEINDAEILSNARLRLEQGRLYEMLMTTEIFQNMDADEQAVKNVQKEIKRFAKDRMEVMLGMKEPVKESSNFAQFNSLEVDVLKSLAKKLSGGETEKVNPVKSGSQPPPKNTTLTPISANASKTKAALKNVVNQPKKAKPQPEEPAKPIDEMTYDEKLAHIQKTNAQYQAKKATNPQAIPMPSYDALNAAHMIKGSKLDMGNAALNKIAKNLLNS